MHATKLICPPLQGLMLMDGWYLRNMSCIQKKKKKNCLVLQAGKVSTDDVIFIAVSITHSSSEVNVLKCTTVNLGSAPPRVNHTIIYRISITFQVTCLQ